jgi:hypothetical protein
MPYVDAQAAETLARILTQVLTTSSGSALIDAGRLISEMEQAGWALVQLPTASDVVDLPGGGRRADFGPVVVTIDAEGHANIQGKGDGHAAPDQGPIAMLAATRWAMVQQQQRGV